VKFSDVIHLLDSITEKGNDKEEKSEVDEIVE